MKWLMCFLLFVISVPGADAQRRDIGNSGRGSALTPSGQTQRPPRSEPSRSDAPAQQPPPPSCQPPVWIMPTPIIPIVIESPVDVSQTDIVESAPDRETPEEEQSEQSVLHDRNSHPDRAGLDFSSGEVVADADEEGDVYFVVDGDGPQFVVKDDTDIQEIGKGEEPLESVSYSSTDWSPAHRVPLQANARYVIWTWDNQYFAFRVVLLAEHRVALEWKRLSGGAKLAANIAYRTGTHHREQPPKFGR